MIDPSLRLRRAIYLNYPLLVSRILKAHPDLLRNPDFTPTSCPTPSLTSAYTGTSSPIGLSNTSLHLAAYLNHKSIVQLLLQLGHEKDGISLNEEYQTPLMLAAREGHTECVLLLVQDGQGGIERRDLRGRDAIMLAATGGWDTIVQILLTYAPPTPYRSSSNNQQVSQFAIPSEKEKDTVAFDPSNPPNPLQYLLNQTDVDGNTALHFAASYGHVGVLNTLLAAGANPTKRNVWSWTPVAYSATMELEVFFRKALKEDERREEGRGGKQQPQQPQQPPQQPPQQHGRNPKLRGGNVRMVVAE